MCRWVDPLAPVVLCTLRAGATFSAATVLEAADLQPPGAAGPLSTPREAARELSAAGSQPWLCPAIPGVRQLMAVQQGAEPLELLCMSRPLFALSVNGGARTATPDEVRSAAG